MLCQQYISDKVPNTQYQYEMKMNQRTSIISRHLRARAGGGDSSSNTLGTAPMVHLESVDRHLPWLHIPKTGSSFANVLFQYACANGPSIKPLRGGPHHWEKYTLDSQYECSQEYSLFPYLYPSDGLDYKDFHAPLSDDIYEHNKGKLVGMLRDPREHKMSLVKHKYSWHVGRESWKSFISSHSLSENDKSLSTFLEYARGYEAGYLIGMRGTFHDRKEAKKEKALVDLAKQRLTEGFQYIGITNRYPESVCLFFSKFAKPGDSSGSDKTCKSVVFKPVNTADGHVSSFNFTNADWDYFETFDDDIDREIYNHALAMFEADLVRYGVTRESCIARGCWPDQSTAVEERTSGWEKSG